MRHFTLGRPRGVNASTAHAHSRQTHTHTHAHTQPSRRKTGEECIFLRALTFIPTYYIHGMETRKCGCTVCARSACGCGCMCVCGCLCKYPSDNFAFRALCVRTTPTKVFAFVQNMSWPKRPRASIRVAPRVKVGRAGVTRRSRC